MCSGELASGSVDLVSGATVGGRECAFRVNATLERITELIREVVVPSQRNLWFGGGGTGVLEDPPCTPVQVSFTGSFCLTLVPPAPFLNCGPEVNGRWMVRVCLLSLPPSMSSLGRLGCPSFSRGMREVPMWDLL